jgi:shikimate kinase / 3-dehydroquinate synthase
MRTSGASIGVAEPAIVFIGFMGSGKTTALAAARDAGLETTEIDDLMAADLGMPIAEAFEQRGEESFRGREAEVVGELLEGADGGAIALGGGSVLSQRVRDALGRHLVVWLQVDGAEAWRRIEGSERPLARSGEDVERLLAERLPLYESLADAIVMPADAGVVARALPSIRALGEFPDGTKLLWAASESGEYPVLAGAGILGRDWWPLEGRRFCISDGNVAPIYAGRLEPLEARIEVEPGEQAKTLGSAEQVLRELTEAGMTRSDHVVALGGGVVGDLAGFCAHTYQRGVAVVQVPTTVVAQVDSAYGGKTGVDLPQAKNYVGAYHQPAAVIADWDTIETLPGPELAAGFVEVLKTALLAGGSLWAGVKEIGQGDLAGQSWVAFDCARYKCQVVAADERDAGLRQVLNLGHTVGHAIEAATGYARYRHGEAVGLGLLATLRLSDAPELRETVESWLTLHGLPVRLDSNVDLDELMTAVERDKKRTAEGVPFVLLSTPGEPRPGQVVDQARVREAVEELAS